MASAIEFVARIEKFPVVAFANESIEFGFAEGLLIEIARSEGEFKFEQETSCFAAGGSRGFLVEADVLVGHLVEPPPVEIMLKLRTFDRTVASG